MRTDQRLEQRRATLMHAALELFVEKGFHETKVSDIVEHAGVAQGTFYLYFPGKRDVFDALMDSWLNQCWEILEKSSSFEPATFDEANARGRFELTQMFRMFSDEPLLTRLMLKQAEGVSPDVSDRMEDFHVRVAQLVEALIERRQVAGLMRAFNAKLIAHAMVGMIERVAFRWFVMDEGPRLKPEELAEELVLFQAFGMALPDGEATRG